MFVLFSDGACSGNPGPGGWACILVTPEGRVRELAGRADATTNNRMEMTGVIAGLRAARGLPGKAVIHTDSTYVLGGIMKWLAGWKRRGWTTASGEPVKNEDLWRELDALVAARGRGVIEWRWVKGHSGHDANERCDELAVALCRKRPHTLYCGPLLSYPYGSLAPCDHKPLPERSQARKSAEPSGPATYLSLLEGRLEKHATWDECSARVKGRSGARFKKVRSHQEEKSVLEDWGL
ncbi:MAG: ribonuclease HI [Elusimicrobia bacterium GWA2_66_18]|nr:MAG: ribonuclease HI [Elusimicrobia bacterium GWA2_66_18]